MKLATGCLGSLGYWIFASMFLAGAVMGDCIPEQEAACTAAKDHAFKVALFVAIGIYLFICLAFAIDGKRRNNSSGD